MSQHTDICTHSLNLNITKSCNQSIASIALTSALSISIGISVFYSSVYPNWLCIHKIRLNMADCNCLHSQIGRQTFLVCNAHAHDFPSEWERVQTNQPTDRSFPSFSLPSSSSFCLHSNYKQRINGKNHRFDYLHFYCTNQITCTPGKFDMTNTSTLTHIWIWITLSKIELLSMCNVIVQFWNENWRFAKEKHITLHQLEFWTIWTIQLNMFFFDFFIGWQLLPILR